MNFHTENDLSENAMFHQDPTPGYYGGPCPEGLYSNMFSWEASPCKLNFSAFVYRFLTIFDKKGDPFTILGDREQSGSPGS